MNEAADRRRRRVCVWLYGRRERRDRESLFMPYALCPIGTFEALAYTFHRGGISASRDMRYT